MDSDSNKLLFKGASPLCSAPFNDENIETFIANSWQQSGGSIMACRLLATIVAKNKEMAELKARYSRVRIVGPHENELYCTKDKCGDRASFVPAEFYDIDEMVWEGDAYCIRHGKE